MDEADRQLKEICEQVLIKGHEKIMQDEFQPLLEADREDGEWRVELNRID